MWRYICTGIGHCSIQIPNRNFAPPLNGASNIQLHFVILCASYISSEEHGSKFNLTSHEIRLQLNKEINSTAFLKKIIIIIMWLVSPL